MLLSPPLVGGQERVAGCDSAYNRRGSQKALHTPPYSTGRSRQRLRKLHDRSSISKPPPHSATGAQEWRLEGERPYDVSKRPQVRADDGRQVTPAGFGAASRIAVGTGNSEVPGVGAPAPTSATDVIDGEAAPADVTTAQPAAPLVAPIDGTTYLVMDEAGPMPRGHRV